MDSKTWNKLVIQHAPLFGAFLQSWQWGEFQKIFGREVKRIFIEKDDHQFIAQAIKMKLPLGMFYWYLPKGPLGNMDPGKIIELLKKELPSAVFYRLEPIQSSVGQRVSDIQPTTTVILDLTKGEEKLFSSMKSKTRYNIRLSERHGVSCQFVSLKYFDDFIRLMDQTTKRDKFSAHPKAYYETMLKNLKSDDLKVSLAIAQYKKHIIAANIVLDFNDTRIYLHGATSNLHRNIMAQYALHWFLIKDAAEKGFKIFDFWGVAPENASVKHTWVGISRYKRGWGGQEVSMPGTFDLPVKRSWYSLYSLVRKIRH